MRVVLDSNVIVSALIARGSLPGQVLRGWVNNNYDLLTCELQIEELRRVTRYPKVQKLIPAAKSGRVINNLKSASLWITRLPLVDRSPDPDDNYLLALAQAGATDFLVTGDKPDLLALGTHLATKIVSVRHFLEVHAPLN